MTSEKQPFFSVVIPLYNKQNHVKETIKSVLGQSFQNFEIVVVNDGSTDESTKVVESIEDDRIRLIHQENAGVSVARNRGIREAKSEYIAFLDADDIWLPEFLETIYELIKKFPNAGLYATAFKKRKANGEESAINIQGLPSKDYVGLIPNYFESIVKGDLLVCASAICIPKKVFIGNDILFPPGEKYGEDQYIWARVALEKKIAYDTNVCAVYCIDAENNTQTGINKLKDPRSFILQLKHHMKLQDDREFNYWFSKYIEKQVFRVITRNINNGYRMYALKQLFKYKLSFINTLKLSIRLAIPQFLISHLKRLK
ncbi:MAG: glycosyltransferase family A protein [Sulfurovaceae bacterium]|nr:glycosyltransferase family A protein [Sulfurovaceae bacterium]